MLFRFIKNRRKPCDIYNMYEGQSIFLLGGHPSLKDENLDLFKLPGITTMAMNNTATIVRPDFWVCADKPECYSKSIIKDPSIIKFARLNYTNDLIDGVMWKDYPATLFYGSNNKIKHHELFEPHIQYVWWQNIFMIALQFCYRLGFKQIYTVGCSFNIDINNQYAYETKLDKGQVDYNHKTYDMIMKQVRACEKHIRDKGVTIKSCTPNSKLNEVYSFLSLPKAIEEVRNQYPQHNTLNSIHSSTFRKKM